MRPYTIIKTLALSLGTLSVVARSLPERRSEINIRAPGGDSFSNPLKNDDVNKAASDPTLATTADVHDLKQRLERMGLVKVSEGTRNGKIHTGNYSMSTNTTFSKRADKNIEGANCETGCDGDWTPIKQNPAPNPEHCEHLYKELYSRAVQFTVNSGEIDGPYVWGDCAAWFVNNSPDTVTYDYWDFGGSVQWANYQCIILGKAKFGSCIFEGANYDRRHSAYAMVAHPSYYSM